MRRSPARNDTEAWGTTVPKPFCLLTRTRQVPMALTDRFGTACPARRMKWRSPGRRCQVPHGCLLLALPPHPDSGPVGCNERSALHRAISFGAISIAPYAGCRWPARDRRTHQRSATGFVDTVDGKKTYLARSMPTAIIAMAFPFSECEDETSHFPSWHDRAACQTAPTSGRGSPFPSLGLSRNRNCKLLFFLEHRVRVEAGLGCSETQLFRDPTCQTPAQLTSLTY